MTNTLRSEIPHQRAAEVAREAAIAAWDAQVAMNDYNIALAFVRQMQYDEDDGSGCAIYASLDFDTERKHHRYAERVYFRHLERLAQGNVCLDSRGPVAPPEAAPAPAPWHSDATVKGLWTI